MKIDIQKVEKSRIDEVDSATPPFGPFTDHMFLADYDGESWGNYRIVPTDAFSIHPATAALHYGQSFFEGMKAFRQTSGDVALFRPDLNAARANTSAERLHMPVFPESDFMESIQKLVEIDTEWVPQSDAGSLYIRPFMFATDAQIGVRPSETYTFCVIMLPAIGGYYDKKLNVLVEETYSRSGPGCPGFAKAAGNYAGSYMPAAQASKKGFDQLIWTDACSHKYVEESGTMNIAAIIDGVLVSPPTSDTILAGTTIQTLFEIADDINLQSERRPILVKELTEGIKNGIVTEIFGCGTAVVVSPFGSVTHKGTKYELPENTPVTKQLKETLQKIRNGELDDLHNWIVKV